MSDESVATDDTPRFITGGKPGPGRPKGARNKLQEDFLRDVLVAWEERGPAAISGMISEKPSDFVKMVAGLMPKDIQLNITDTSEMTDDELAKRVRQLAAELAPFLALGIGDAEKGTGDAGSKALATRVH